MNVVEEFAYWRVVRRGLLEALDMLNDDQLAFVPREGLWSLGQVACHIAKAEDGWFRYAVTCELSQWPAAPDRADCASVAAVRSLLDRTHAHTVALLEATAVARLDDPVDVPWGEELTLREIIWHVIGHEIHHRGEIYLMMGLLGLEAPGV
jgi:uncharacterized damage-inducible protein DinB